MALKLCNLCRSLIIKTKQPLIYATTLRNYKSQHSVENIYPNSNQDRFRNIEIKHTYSDDRKEAFSGFVPVDKLDIKHMKSSGPGGQNVNKVNTKVEIRFHIESADWIPDWIKTNIIREEKGKINKEGYLIVTSEKTRKQLLNQADCINKIRSLVYTHSILPKEPTEEELQVKAERIAKAKASTLKAKRQHSLKKQGRQAGYDCL